jgi:hypothetical protein
VPLVRIEVLGERTAAERVELFDAVHEAIVSAFRVPEDDRTQRLVEHAPGTFEIPPGRSERYTLIEITAFPGRSVDAKRSSIARSSATSPRSGSPRATSRSC